jgi:dTDP-4-dehydrorhamnose 3,5-epimerase
MIVFTAASSFADVSGHGTWFMKLQRESLNIPDVCVLRGACYVDNRGYTSETYNRQVFAEIGIEIDFVQDLQSYSRRQGTVRGLHFQIDPCAQHTIVRVVRGSIFDVAVDIRPSSPTFGGYVARELPADPSEQIYIPAGFAHGFCTLEPETTVFYKMSNYYSSSHDAGIRWNDPQIAVPWPIDVPAEISERDRQLPLLRDALRILA